MLEKSIKYLGNKYDYEGRFGSYWNQINEIFLSMNGKSKKTVLEIGPGNNFLKDYLVQREVKVETLDITSETKPTYIGSATEIPCLDMSFDCVVAFQVLELKVLNYLEPV